MFTNKLYSSGDVGWSISNTIFLITKFMILTCLGDVFKLANSEWGES